jgi:hypothetical protein
MLTVEERMAIVGAQVQGLSREEVRHTITLYSFLEQQCCEIDSAHVQIYSKYLYMQ